MPPPPDGPALPNALNATVAKWFDNHTAAVSITFDDRPTLGREPDIDGFMIEQGLVLGYEVITRNTFRGDLVFNGPDDEMLVYLLEELVLNGFGYFGHGHDHIDHDELSYNDALRSFQACYDTMKDWGLKPVAYAYPRNAGHDEETQQALEASGFLSGRLQTHDPTKYYNLPGSQRAPDNWFGLQAVDMQSIEFADCATCINDNRELLPVLEEALDQRAWVILTYHNIGNPDGWGWYDWDEFQDDVRSIAARDIWTAPMNDIVLYTRERENILLDVKVIADPLAGEHTESIEITLSDGLDNITFDQPLTILFEQPRDWIGTPLTVSQDHELLDEVVFETEAAMLSLVPNERPYVLHQS